ncbi:MAG: SMC-Scp complex subunit ScpB [Paracoccus sp. (in: a-proteobacteria)]|uniref:SMC-Scp complex subunit ScpB n=1 Tax=Paracoccus sp. TaxID=267 RepID=UPI0026DF4176|nr:SMC-Scp complex subunit ScpB [Paracoccus sp. (in: a-proteobacteria)]MDO5613686.1 SMC-Scp complex subunit ScpB [Paracoccus sp. (in: a-proteobacteria)]
MTEDRPHLRIVGDADAQMPPPPMSEQERMVEAMLFASAGPLTLADMGARMPLGCDPAEALRRLRPRYEGRGVELVRVGQAWAMRSAGDLGFLMRQEAVETRRLSRAGIETLAIIAYHQPVTRAEIEEIRGVAVSRGTLDLLIELDWVKPGRRRMTPGRPATYVVTEAFLDHFGLESARDLPGLAELRAAGLLDATPPDGALAGGVLSGLARADADDDIEGGTGEAEGDLFGEREGD